MCLDLTLTDQSINDPVPKGGMQKWDMSCIGSENQMSEVFITG